MRRFKLFLEEAFTMPEACTKTILEKIKPILIAQVGFYKTELY